MESGVLQNPSPNSMQRGKNGPVVWPSLYVYLSDDNFRKFWRSKFIFAHAAYLHALQVKFVYEDHRVKVKVTGAKKVKKIPIPTLLKFNQQ